MSIRRRIDIDVTLQKLTVLGEVFCNKTELRKRERAITKVAVAGTALASVFDYRDQWVYGHSFSYGYPQIYFVLFFFNTNNQPLNGYTLYHGTSFTVF